VKIAFIVHDYHRHGGHARYVAELASRFKKDHEVHVYASVWEEPDPDGIHFHRVSSIRWTALTSIASFILPASFILLRKFDIVHAQGLCGLRQNVVTAHICNKAWYQAAEEFGGPLPLRKRINKWIVTALERLTFRSGAAHAFIAVSDRIRKDLLELHRIPSPLVHVIHHGVDLATFSLEQRKLFRRETRDRLGLQENELVFLYVGDWQKAGPPLAAAIKKLKGGRLVLVTKTDPTVIQTCLSEFDLTNRVILCPPTREIQKFYAAADVFVFPSYYDSFGMVVTEAMASGLPVITNNSVGASELLTDGVNGILVTGDDPWDPDVLAKAMDSFLGNQELACRMGEAARSAVESLTWDHCATRTLEVYRQVYEHKRAQR
jgi:UDP-glucose:(heptosyl)LPS alpha-1,3-glucosyltransferase